MLILFYCSCYTKQDNNIIKYPYNTTTLNGHNLRDSGKIITITGRDSSTTYLDFYFALIDANRKSDVISCSLSGLPAGIVDSPGAASYLLPLGLHTPLHISNTDTGLHTFYVHISGAYGDHTYPVQLHVLPPFDNALGLVGTWSSTHNCGTDSCMMTISPVAGQPHWINIRNFQCLGDSVIVHASVSDSGLITIPYQTSNGYSIFGHRQLSALGMSAEQAFTIQDTVIDGSDTMVCFSWWERR